VSVEVALFHPFSFWVNVGQPSKGEVSLAGLNRHDDLPKPPLPICKALDTIAALQASR